MLLKAIFEGRGILTYGTFFFIKKYLYTSIIILIFKNASVFFLRVLGSKGAVLMHLEAKEPSLFVEISRFLYNSTKVGNLFALGDKGNGKIVFV